MSSGQRRESRRRARAQTSGTPRTVEACPLAKEAGRRRGRGHATGSTILLNSLRQRERDSTPSIAKSMMALPRAITEVAPRKARDFGLHEVHDPGWSASETFS